MRVSGEHTLGGHPREWNFFCSSHLCLCAQGFFVSGWRSNWMRLARMRAATPSKNMFRRFTREIGHTHTAMQNKNDKKRRGEKSGWRDEHELSTEYRDCSTQNTLASCTIRNAITINAMDSNGAHTHDIPRMISDGMEVHHPWNESVPTRNWPSMHLAWIYSRVTTIEKLLILWP